MLSLIYYSDLTHRAENIFELCLKLICTGWSRRNERFKHYSLLLVVRE